MKRMAQKLKELVNKVKILAVKLSFMFPTKLPQGMTEFDAWANDISNVYGLPSNDSVKFALATMVLHAKSTDAYVPKHYFGMSALKSAANQVAAGVMQDLKQKQAEAIKQAQELAAIDPDVPPVSGAV